MIPTNVYCRVFHLKYDNSIATGFVIDVNEKTYLITARHFANKILGDTTIQIFYQSQWKNVKVKLVGHGGDDIDISVLAQQVQLAERSLTLPADMGGLTYGQDTFFLGYPYGWFGELKELNWHFPMPFVKKAIVSCISNTDKGTNILFLDGHNNEGFSGGPVVFKRNGSEIFKVGAVISGYRFIHDSTFIGNEKSPITFKYNTGIIVAYGINHAIDLINANPIGVDVTA